MKPALAPQLLGSRIPRDSEALQAAAWKWDEVLLQREITESVGQLIILKLAIGSFGANVIFCRLFYESWMLRCRL